MASDRDQKKSIVILMVVLLGATRRHCRVEQCCHFVTRPVGFFMVGTKEEGKGWDVHLGTLMWSLEKGMYTAGILFVGFSALLIWMLFETETQGWKYYVCIIIGLVSGAAIGKVTEYFTSFDFGPVISIKDRGRTGPATVVIQGTVDSFRRIHCGR